MKLPANIALGLLAAVIGFGGGYYVSSAKSAKAREDLALVGVLENLGHVHFLERQDEATATKLAHLNLDRYLRQLDENEGHNLDAQWLGAKARALSAVALRWEGRDLVKDLGLEGEIAKDWAEGHVRNLAMLKRAQETCRAHPEYECKTELPLSP
jgi:hypothetical protein